MFRIAVRRLSKDRALSALAILTLALGIGANTAIFSIYEGVVLKPLPYPEPGRLALVLLYNRSLKSQTLTSYPDFLDWQNNSRSFENMAAYKAQGFDVTGSGNAVHVEGTEVTPGFFKTLRVMPALGRDFEAQDEFTSGMKPAIVSHRFWRDRFANNPAALGQRLVLNGAGYILAGILPEDFRFEDQPADIYTPLDRRAVLLHDDRTVHDLACIARLKRDVSLSQARAEMSAVQERIATMNPATERGQGAAITPLQQIVVGNVDTTLTLLLGAVVLVLLIACANVANLLLGRSAARTREFAVQLALGAPPSSILRQLISESLLLACTGGVCGILFARWGLRALLAILPLHLPRAANVDIDGYVLLFGLGASILTGLVIGLAPGLKAVNTDVYLSMKESGRGSIGTRHGSPSLLVVVQVALALVLVMGGSLLLRTIRNLNAVHPGFDAHNVLSFQVGLSPTFSDSAPKTRAAFQQLTARIRNIPGVEAAGLTALVPMGGTFNQGPFWPGTQRPSISMAEIPRAVYYPTGPDYLRTMGIPLLSGRYLSTQDDRDSDLVVLIDTLLAREFFPGTNPVGQTLTIPHWGVKTNVPARIVGVVGHVEQYGLDGSGGEKPQITYSFYQLPDDAVPMFRTEVSLVVRTRLATQAVMPEIRKAVGEAGSDQPVYNVRPVQQLLSDSIEQQRLAMFLLAAFAGLALLLSSVGTYAVVSYSVTRRVQEIGIRMALGAKPLDVLRLVVVHGVTLAFAGIAIGGAASFALARVLPSFSRLLYGVHAGDPWSLATTSIVLLAATLVACYVPARRAASLDPLVALREE